MSEIFSGNTITIENLGNSKAKLNKIGMSHQKTRSGKNKLDYSYISDWSNVQSNTYKFIEIKNIDTTKAHTISGIDTTAFDNDISGAYVFWAKGTSYDNIIWSNQLCNNRNKLAYSGVTLPSNFSDSGKLYLAVHVEGGITEKQYRTVMKKFEKAQLEEGTVATDYEPYGAMPSPEFPSTIENITGSAKIIVCNENLFDSKAIPEMSGTTYGVECKIDNDGIITLSSNTNPSGYLSTRRILRELCPKLKEGDVAYLFLETTHATKGIWLYNVEMMWSANTSKIITKEMLDGIVSIYGGNKQTDTIKIMITSNKLATEYKPHQSQTFLFPLKPGQRMYKDSYLADDGVHHKRKQIVLDGSESWMKQWMSDTSNMFMLLNFLDDSVKYEKATTNIICKSTHFTSTHYDGGKGSMWDKRADNNSLYVISINDAMASSAVGSILIKDMDFTEISDFKQFLSDQYNAGTPVTVEYELENEIIEPYTPEQENIYMQLQNMELYEGINYVFVKGEPYAEIEVTVNKLIEDYDAYISATGRLIIPSLNINYLVDFNESNIPTMPEAVESSVRAAGRDGDIVLNTTYEPIPFNIVCYTEDNLTLIEKVEEEKKVNKLLNSIKNGTMTFALEKSNKFYNVKYSGALTTINYPKHLKFSIPLKSSESYGKDLIKKSIVGNSVGESQTAEKVGALFILRGPATNPMIALNDYSMEYNMSILEGARVEINSSKSTITNINASGVKTNVMKYYNHQFPKIENGVNELKVLSGFDSDMQVSVIWNDLKL